MYDTSRPDGWGDTQVDAFVEPETGAPVAGLPRIGDVFVVRTKQKPLWVAFPVAEALKPIVTTRRTTFEQMRDAYDKEVAEFTAWKSPAKRAARRADWQKAAKTMPNGGAEFVASMEQTDPQIEAANTARLGPGGPEETRVKEAERALQEAEALIGPLSPDARTRFARGWIAEAARGLRLA